MMVESLEICQTTFKLGVTMKHGSTTTQTIVINEQSVTFKYKVKNGQTKAKISKQGTQWNTHPQTSNG